MLSFISDSTSNPVPKIHPATRQLEPEDPMNLHGFEVPGDTELMLRIVVEEYARMGSGFESIMNIFRDPFYQAPHGLWQLYGDEELSNRVMEILSRCGIMRTTTVDVAPSPDQLIQLDVSETLLIGGDSKNKASSVDSRESSRPSQSCEGENDDA